MNSLLVIALATFVALAAFSTDSAAATDIKTKFLFRPSPWIPLPIPLPPPAGGQCSIPTKGGCAACGATPGTGPECGGDKTKRVQCYDPAATCTPDCKDNCQPKCDANCDW